MRINQIFIFLTCIFFSLATYAQGKGGNNYSKKKRELKFIDDIEKPITIGNNTYKSKAILYIQ